MERLATGEPSMIVVTGATGQLGRGIVEQLLQRLPAAQLGVSVRDPAKAQGLAARGVRVRQGDFEDAASLRHAFEGASQVLLVSSNAASIGGDPLAQHRTTIEVAKAVGVRRIVYTSQIAASATSAFLPALDHAATEAMLRASGLPFTALRNGFYAASAAAMLGRAIQSGELVTPVDGKFSWTAHADLAEAAARILCEEGHFEGPTPPLTGFVALDFGELCAVASEVTGKQIRRVTVSDDEYCANMIRNGAPPARAAFALGMFVASRRGEFATVDPTLEQLLGRKPLSFKEVLAAKPAA
jgi:NAD(P)H dehydrogenase (quinone)